MGNIGSMQMNMNMVMVGRQLEQFKQEKKRIKAKLNAKKETWVSHPKGKTSVPQKEDDDWNKNCIKKGHKDQ